MSREDVRRRENATAVTFSLRPRERGWRLTRRGERVAAAVYTAGVLGLAGLALLLLLGFAGWVEGGGG